MRQPSLVGRALSEPEHYGDLWILTHPELLGSLRVRATLDYYWYAVMERRAPALGRES